HVLLVHIVGDETMKEREPCAGAFEEPLAPRLVGAPCMIDKFSPTIAVPRNGVDRLEFDWRIRAVQARNELEPGNIEPEILRLVDDPRTVRKGEDADRSATIVGVGQIAFDLCNHAFDARAHDVAADCWKIGGESKCKLA